MEAEAEGKTEEIAKDTSQNADSTAEEDEVDFKKACELEESEEKQKEWKLVDSGKKIKGEFHKKGDVLKLSESDFENSRKLSVLRRENELIPVEDVLLYYLKIGTTVNGEFHPSGSTVELSESDFRESENLTKLRERGKIVLLEDEREELEEIELLKDELKEYKDKFEASREQLTRIWEEIKDEVEPSATDLSINRYRHPVEDIEISEEERVHFQCQSCGHQFKTGSKQRYVKCGKCGASTRRDKGVQKKEILLGDIVDFLNSTIDELDEFTEIDELIYDSVQFYLAQRGG